MRIGKFWKIESDALNVILQRKRKRTRKSDGLPYEDWEIVGYYSSVATALHGMVEQRIRDTDLTDFIVISGEIDKLHMEIERLPNTYHATRERNNA